MGYVHTSVTEAFENTYKDIKTRSQKGHAIYGTGNFRQDIITQEGIGIKPKISGNIIEDRETEINSMLGRGLEGYSYTVKNKVDKDSFAAATKDELYLFVIMAHPNLLKKSDIQKAVHKRLLDVYKEELVNGGVSIEDVKTEAAKFVSIFKSISKAVKGRGYEVYYAGGNQQEESLEAQPE